MLGWETGVEVRVELAGAGGGRVLGRELAV